MTNDITRELELANKNDFVAQYNVGIAHLKGVHRTKDYAEAMKWLRLAADQGHREAVFNIGLMYRDGKGVPQNGEKAIEWYKRAMEKDIRMASKIGDMYHYGSGVPKDEEEAKRWYNKLTDKMNISTSENEVPENNNGTIAWLKTMAEEGGHGAAEILGDIYEYGKGVSQDRNEAIKWYKLALEQNSCNKALRRLQGN